VAELDAAMNLQACANTLGQPDRLRLTESHLIHRAHTKGAERIYLPGQIE
jgi:hypothetical protein